MDSGRNRTRRGDSEGIDHQSLDPDKVVSPFSKNSVGGLPKHLCQIVSSQVDVDRMDYLARDSHFAGVALGRVDIYYLINCLTVVAHDAHDVKRPVSLGVKEKGVKAYEGFALARHLMNRTVYYHKAVKVFEFMMEELLRRIIREFDQIDADPVFRTTIPPYLRAVAKFRNAPKCSASTDAFVHSHWREYFALSEHDIWCLVTTLANTRSETVSIRTRRLAQMILGRRKLPSRLVEPGRAEVLREKLFLDEYRENEDYALIDLSTTVYE